MVSLGASAVSAQLDPAWHTSRLSLSRLSLSRLRRRALISAAVAAPLALILSPIAYGMWQDSYWHPAADEPLETAAFAPDRGLMVTASGESIDGTDMMWDVTDLSRPRRLPSGLPRPTETPLCSACDGLGNYAVAFAPDGHTLTVVVDRAEMSANSGRDTIFDWPVTGSGTLGAVRVTVRDVADFQPVIAPGDRTVLGSPPGSHTWHAWPLS